MEGIVHPARTPGDRKGRSQSNRPGRRKARRRGPGNAFQGGAIVADIQDRTHSHGITLL